MIAKRRRRSVSLDDDSREIYFSPKSWAAVDTECTGTKIHKGCKPFIVSITDYKGKSFLWETRVDPVTRQPQWSREQIDQIRWQLGYYELMVFHNAKFDISMLLEIDVDIRHKPFWDTCLASHLQSSSEPHGLKEQAVLHLDILDDDQKDLQKSVIKAGYYARKNNWTKAESTHWNYWWPKAVAISADYPKDHPFHTVATKYAGRDTYRTALLYRLQRESSRIIKSFPLLKREFDLVKVVRKMERFGVHISRKRLAAVRPRFEKMQHDAEESCKRVAENPELNIRSNPQLQQLLFKDWGLPAKRQTKTGFSTDAKTIDWLIGLCESSLPEKKRRVLPFLQGLKKYSSTKAAVGYLRSYAEENVNGILHSSFNQMGAAATTRFSCGDPNVQNVGKGKELEDGEVDFILREPFGPKPGRVWYDFDFDQLQLRIFAYVAQEQSIIDAFDAGWDFHNFVASRLFHTDKPTKLQRRIAKNVNFALIFGGGRNKVDETAGESGTYDKFRKQFPCIDRYMDAIIKDVRKNGYVRTLAGYPLDVPYQSPYVGVCYIVQGTEGDIAKYALLEADAINEKPEYKSLDPHITNFVHDEIVDDCIDTPLSLVKPLLLDIRRGMERSGKRCGVKTPASCEIVRKSWDKGLKLAL